MLILLTNDDGVEAPGLQALAEALRELPGVELAIVAPMRNRTGAGTQLTFGPLTVLEHAPVSGVPAWAVDGTPGDAVSIGLLGLFRETPPTLVMSGVNQGLNVGRMALPSGTVGAALRAVMLGVPGFAVSSQTPWTPAVEDFAEAAHLARRLLSVWLAEGGMPAAPGEVALLSLNVPRGYNGQVRWTRQGRRHFREHYRRDEDGVTYHPVLEMDSLEPHAAEALAEADDTDVGALARGFATLTPMQPELFSADTYRVLPAAMTFDLPPLYPAVAPAAEDRISLPPEAEVQER